MWATYLLEWHRFECIFFSIGFGWVTTETLFLSLVFRAADAPYAFHFDSVCFFALMYHWQATNFLTFDDFRAIISSISIDASIGLDFMCQKTQPTEYWVVHVMCVSRFGRGAQCCHCICAHQFWIAYAFHLFACEQTGPQQAIRQEAVCV